MCTTRQRKAKMKFLIAAVFMLAISVGVVYSDPSKKEFSNCIAVPQNKIELYSSNN